MGKQKGKTGYLPVPGRKCCAERSVQMPWVFIKKQEKDRQTWLSLTLILAG